MFTFTYLLSMFGRNTLEPSMFIEIAAVPFPSSHYYAYIILLGIAARRVATQLTRLCAWALKARNLHYYNVLHVQPFHSIGKNTIWLLLFVFGAGNSYLFFVIINDDWRHIACMYVPIYVNMFICSLVPHKWLNRFWKMGCEMLRPDSLGD